LFSELDDDAVVRTATNALVAKERYDASFWTEFLQFSTLKDVIEFHAFALPLEALACVCPMTFLSGLHFGWPCKFHPNARVSHHLLSYRCHHIWVETLKGKKAAEPKQQAPFLIDGDAHAPRTVPVFGRNVHLRVPLSFDALCSPT
jgi:hypothetical protein